MPVAVQVRDFALPSTSSLPTYFGFRWDACALHFGSYEDCGDAGIEEYDLMYATSGLNHWLILSLIYYFPSDPSGWDHFDSVYAPLFDGTADTILEGTRWTTVHVYGDTAQQYAMRREHLEDMGWTEHTELFAYTCDEPPLGCDWPEMNSRDPIAQAGGVPSLVTTTDSEAVDRGVIDAIDLPEPIR